MTLPVTFGRAAYAEFIEAVAWYEAQRPGLGGEFIAQINAASCSPPGNRGAMPWFTMAFAGSSPTGFRTAFTFARR